MNPGSARPLAPAPILALSDLQERSEQAHAWEAGAPTEAVDAAEAAAQAERLRSGTTELQRARQFSAELLAGHTLDTGEDAWSHACGVAQILADLGAAQSLQAAAYLVYAADYLQSPTDAIARAFGPSQGQLVGLTRQLVQIQRAAQRVVLPADAAKGQGEAIRKMLLAFSRDLRVVLLRLASRLQTLRWFAASKRPCPASLARETLDIFAPLANRLGIGQIKWQIEDLAFRFLQPQEYHAIAAQLDERRTERETGMQRMAADMEAALQAAGLPARVLGRPKHLYSIWRKMQGKRLQFHQLMDLRAVRVIVDDVDECYACLAHVHEAYTPVDGEFDDYIAKPKANGYQSLHTVVRDAQGRAIEVQIRTAAMHEHAEFGVAAHWAYKEAGARGYAGVTAAGSFEDSVAQARKTVLQQLLQWERETVDATAPGVEDRIYVFTPQSTVVDLPAGGTPVDFAYALHTELGHRCRGAKVDGVLVSLNTPLRTGQTVEVLTVREGGPSLDWLNAELNFLASPRARAKVRAWFNAQELAATVARGREAVEKLLQREGRTATKLDDLALQLGFKTAADLFEVVGKDEFSLRAIENLWRPAPAAADTAEEDSLPLRRPKAAGGTGHVLVVGVDALLTNLARCCRPAPPDAISGFVTRGRGVAIHRSSCQSLQHLAQQYPERIIAVAWSGEGASDAVYPADIRIEALDRPGLLRDIGEVFARDKINVTGVKTQSVRDRHGRSAHMTFTVEVRHAQAISGVLQSLAQVEGVRQAQRRTS